MTFVYNQKKIPETLSLNVVHIDVIHLEFGVGVGFKLRRTRWCRIHAIT